MIAKALRSTSFRTFVLYPVLVVGWESLLNRGRPPIEPLYLTLLAWGYFQYRLTGKYRTRLGGGGPGMSTAPDRLVTTGPYAWCRNPMYAGHIVFLAGLALTFRSLLAAVVLVATAVWFHLRIQRDEERLRARFGQVYETYSTRVTRWIPRLF